jgi:hypothetical protein
MKQTVKMQAAYEEGAVTYIALQLIKQGFSVTATKSDNLWTIEAEKELLNTVSIPSVWTESPVVPYTLTTTTKGDSL